MIVIVKIIGALVALAFFLNLNRKVNCIMSTQQELAAQLTGLKDQLGKVAGEITGKIASLEEAVRNAGNTTPEVDQALADLRTTVQQLDDIVPDAPAPTPGEGG